MSGDTVELFRLIGFVQDDLRGCQAKLTSLRAQLAALNLPVERSPHVCPVCGLDRKTASMLEAHLVNVHDVSSDGGRTVPGMPNVL